MSITTADTKDTNNHLRQESYTAVMPSAKWQETHKQRSMCSGQCCFMQISHVPEAIF